MAIFAGVGRAPAVIDPVAATALGIKGSAHGIQMGWFNWPYNFDPMWLEACSGFEEKKP